MISLQPSGDSGIYSGILNSGDYHRIGIYIIFFSVSGRLRHVNLMRIKLEHRQDRKGQAGAVLNRRQ